MVVHARGIPLGSIIASANRHDSPLLGATFDALDPLEELPDRASVHLDHNYDSNATRRLLADRGLVATISEKGKPATLAATRR